MADLLAEASKSKPMRVRDLILALRKAANHEALVQIEYGVVLKISRVDYNSLGVGDDGQQKGFVTIVARK